LSIINLNLWSKKYFRENGGNLLMVHINTITMDVLLVNIYVPNRDDPNFYINLNEILQNLKYLTLFLLAVGT